MNHQQKQYNSLLYKIAIQQNDVQSAGRIYDYCKSKGFIVDKSIKKR